MRMCDSVKMGSSLMDTEANKKFGTQRCLKAVDGHGRRFEYVRSLVSGTGFATDFYLKGYMEDTVERPPAEKRKIHSKNEFELCYLRHQYLRRVTYNPTEADMAPYNQLVTHLARKTFSMYRNLFILVGFDIDDVINIAKIHLVSFLGLYKLDKVPHKLVDFLDVYWKKNIREAKDEDIDNKDRANLTMFMKQRMEDVVRVCRQKARNIKGMPVEEYYVFVGPKRPPKELRLLLENHEKYHFRKLDMASYKTIKRRLKIKTDEEPFKFAGNWHVAVPLEKRNLTLLDFSGAGYDPYDSIHNKNPEELFFEKIRETEYEEKKANFEAQSDKRKENIVRNFIRKNKGDPKFSEEINLARKFLKDMRA